MTAAEKNVKLHWSCFNNEDVEANQGLKTYFESEKQKYKDSINIDEVVDLIRKHVKPATQFIFGGVNIKAGKLIIEFTVKTCGEMVRKTNTKMYLYKFLILPANISTSNIIDLDKIIENFKQESIAFIVLENSHNKIY